VKTYEWVRWVHGCPLLGTLTDGASEPKDLGDQAFLAWSHEETMTWRLHQGGSTRSHYKRLLHLSEFER
jgi:hypothetical protein